VCPLKKMVKGCMYQDYVCHTWICLIIIQMHDFPHSGRFMVFPRHGLWFKKLDNGMCLWFKKWSPGMCLWCKHWGRGYLVEIAAWWFYVFPRSSDLGGFYVMNHLLFMPNDDWQFTNGKSTEFWLWVVDVNISLACSLAWHVVFGFSWFWHEVFCHMQWTYHVCQEPLVVYALWVTVHNGKSTGSLLRSLGSKKWHKARTPRFTGLA